MHFLIGFLIVCIIFAVPALRNVAVILIGLAVLLFGFVWLYANGHSSAQQSTGSQQFAADSQQAAPDEAATVKPISPEPPPLPPGGMLVEKLPSKEVDPSYAWRGDVRAYACADAGVAPAGYTPCVFPNTFYNRSYWNMNREARACANYYATPDNWSALEFCRNRTLR
jgi:hypothetical protein